MPNNLDLEKQQSGDNTVSVYKASGKLSLETVSGFVQQMRSEPASYVVMDLSGVTFLDSAGVGALVSLFVNRRNQKKALALTALPAQAQAVVTVAGLQNLLPIYRTLDEALAKKPQ